ncbi:MAG TPA: sulfite exporter TauE/SafE family protein [Gemmatimonadales bacterium]|nr:sulfite exporter TauE/SafE family protein [Gemmatimonadales bacterium]
MALLGFSLAALIGLSLGFLGGGGSILTVPILVYVLGFTAKSAIAMSLPIVGATSLVGAVGHWRAGNVRLQTALLFGLAAMAGAFVGARAAGFLTGAVQLAILAVVMLAAAVSMLRGGIGSRRDSTHAAELEAGPALALLLPTALGTGVLTGIVGIGGGVLIVPALVLFARVPMRQAVGTSLVVIAMNSVAGAAGYAGRVAVPWSFMAAFTGVAILGIVAGTALVRYVPQAQLKRAFALVLVGVGLFTLYQNRAVF